MCVRLNDEEILMAVKTCSPLTILKDGKSLGILYYDTTGTNCTPVYVCPLITVDGIQRNIDDNSSIITLKYNNGQSDVVFDVPLTSFNTKDISNELLSNSFIFMDNFARDVCEYLINCIRSFPIQQITYRHNRLGFNQTEKLGEFAFFGKESYNTDTKSTLLGRSADFIRPNWRY